MNPIIVYGRKMGVGVTIFTNELQEGEVGDYV
jgi:hypothetical protein